MHTLAISAAENPAVCSDRRFISTDSSVFIFFIYKVKIASRSFIVGLSICTCLSNLPGRNKASSSISTLFVAAIIITPELSAKPSISVSNVFSVFSWSSLVLYLRPLFLPIESISSMKTIAGATDLASSNKLRTLADPTP